MENNKIKVERSNSFDQEGFVIQLNSCQLEGICDNLNDRPQTSQTMITHKRPRLMRLNTYDASIFRKKLLKFPSKTDETLQKFRTAFSELKSNRRSSSDYIEKSIIELKDTCNHIRTLTRRPENYNSRLNEIQASVIELRRLYFKQQEDKMEAMLESAALKREIKDITIDISMTEQQCCSLF